jgi:hypothetical protein
VTPRYHHHFEGASLEEISADLVAAILARNTLFVDVGAHCGSYTLLAQTNPCPTLIKVDTDRHELAVLRGLSTTLSRFPDVSFLIGFNPKMQRAADCEPEALLQEPEWLGCAMFVLDDKNRQTFLIKANSAWHQFKDPKYYANVYCVKRERALSRDRRVRYSVPPSGTLTAKVAKSANVGSSLP